ncbi:hypothetical protein SLE2022_268030 [Rubroshorea leprosula]
MFCLDLCIFTGFRENCAAPHLSQGLHTLEKKKEAMVLNVLQSSGFVPKTFDLAAKELIAVATLGEVDLKQLGCAKLLTKTAILMNLESRIVALEDIRRQVLTYGKGNLWNIS